MNEVLTVPFAAVAAVLMIAGGFKVVRPAATVGAMHGVGLPSSVAIVRCLGIAEIVVGAGALATEPAVSGWAVAAFYAAFTAFVAVALRSASYLQTCGCFGALEVPPTSTHLVVNGLALLGAVLAAVLGTPSLGSALGAEPAGGAVLLGATAVAAGMVVALLTVLPMAGATSRPVANGPTP